MNLMELFVKVGIDDQASGKIGGISDKLKGGLATAGKVAAAGVAAVTAATVAAGTAMAKGISQTAQYGDNIDKMSQKMGISAKAFQEWDFIMQHNGTSIESLQPAMKTLANAVENNNKAFQRLGLTQEQISKMSQEELFGATIKSLQQVEDTTERTYLAGQLLGRGATELGALLNMSAEETEAMRLQVHELGGVMSDDAVKAAAAYQDSLQNMKTAFSGISRGMLSEFLPSVTTIMDGLTDIFGGKDSGIDKISQGVEDFVDKLSKAMPKVLEAGGKIVNSIVTAISDNLPILLEAGLDVVMNILQGITDNLPKIVEALLGALPLLVQAGLDLIIALATGIADNLDTLIPAVIDAVLKIADTLTDPDNLSKLLDAALQLVVALAEGLVDNIDELIDGVFEIVDGIIEFLTDPKNIQKLVVAASKLIVAIATGLVKAIPKLAEGQLKVVNKIQEGIGGLAKSALTWGKDLMDSFVKGIKEKIKKVVDAVKGVAEKVKDILGFSEPKEGPLSNFHTYAPDMMDLFIKGVKDNEGKLTAQIEKTFNFGRLGNFENAEIGVATSKSSVGSFANQSAGGSTKKTEFVFSIDDSQNMMGLARALLPLLKVAEKEVYA